MSGLETAIRHALERSDRASPETRARIYQSARNALEAGLRKQDVHDVDVITQQRHRLETIIHAIEVEERTAVKAREAAVVPPPVRMGDAAPPSSAASRNRSDGHHLDGHFDERPAGAHIAAIDDGVMPPSGNTRRTDAPAIDGGLDDLRADRTSGLDAAALEARPDNIRADSPKGRGRRKDVPLDAVATKKPRRRRRGRLLSLFMVAATLVAAFGIAAWWAETSGLLKTQAERDTGVANPPSTVTSEDFDGSAGLKTLGAAAGFSGEWLKVFEASPSASLTPRARATVNPVSDDGGSRMHITSASSESDGAAVIEVPVSVLEQLSGKTSTVAVTVQSDNGKPTQFSVECDFASLGDCGRHRFTVNDEKSDMLFNVTFDRSLAPSAPGQILINSDVSGKGNSLNLYTVRVLPGQ